jgi:hypothetical protein
MDGPARCQAVYSKLEIVIFLSIDGWRFTNCVNLEGDEWKAMSGRRRVGRRKKTLASEMQGGNGKGERDEAGSSLIKAYFTIAICICFKKGGLNKRGNLLLGKPRGRLDESGLKHFLQF